MKHAVYIDNHGRVKKVSIEFFGSIYKKSLAYIYKTSKKFPDKKIVLIFHHAISKKSIDPKYLNHPSLPSVLTDIAEQLVDSIPNLKLIIHGHVHQSHDYWIKNVRVICNPCGIVNKEPKLSENPNFNKDFIVEI
jgi:Icc-related predicted phosphoesterase